MYRFIACSIVFLLAVSSNAAEPPSRHQDELCEIKHLLSDLTRRVANLENSILNQQTSADVSIHFDLLRIPYSSDDERELARTQISAKGRDTYFAGHFSTDAGWRNILVDDSCDIESGVVRTAALSLKTGLMSEILDDGKALYIVHVTNRTH
ncbi:hypothetical protein [Planctomycetes bacterium TBK1r]|uniref:Uncharacterized protein n=1 Tax=Stieleria magnilauensis TaxID=2527963 RepID=A0ABX5XIT9_9BACT|nr:hypothetical protein TBK1r_08110 [Planctomycetes bacterium TBK1r]